MRLYISLYSLAETRNLENTAFWLIIKKELILNASCSFPASLQKMEYTARNRNTQPGWRPVRTVTSKVQDMTRVVEIASEMFCLCETFQSLIFCEKADFESSSQCLTSIIRGTFHILVELKQQTATPFQETSKIHNIQRPEVS